jgi:hypothetical protein
MKWPMTALDLEDPINQAIWSESPVVQQDLQPARHGTVGSVGAGQALVGPDPLPWVPDLVGREWRTPDSVLVFGASYADFFTRWANRPGRLTSAYRADAPWSDFQQQYVRAVVDDDAAYYDKVQQLLQDAGLPRERVLLTDLCRASFVEIESGGSSASETLLTTHARLFNAYVAANRAWHHRRLRAWQGTVLVGLGRLATAGLLHLLSDGRPDDTTWMKRSPALGVHAVRWQGRDLQVLRVPHPSAWGDPHPRDGAPLLRALLRGEVPEAPIGSRRSTKGRAVAPASTSRSRAADALWKDALRPAKPLPAAELLARHPDAASLTATLLDEVTATRVVAIANAMYNPCRPANLRKMGRDNPPDAWRVLLERRNEPYQRSGTKWSRLVDALQVIPDDVKSRVARMDILELGALSAALIRGPYNEM